MRLNSHRSGFTLIELLAVVVIILILAGIVLGLVKFANEKAARAKAEGEISAISAALESYKTDNGTYPKEVPPVGSTDANFVGATDKLNAQVNDLANSSDTTLYNNASAVLYQAISGDPGGTSNSPVYGKTYYNVPTAMVSPKATAKANGVDSKYLVDPFGNPYGYSTIYESNAAAGKSTDATGYNPTFDLWSTAGYGPIKTYPSAQTVPNRSVLWIKNW